MKTINCLILTMGACGFAQAQTLYHEPFDYPAADLTGVNGGTGWTQAWTDSGNPTVVSPSGLTFTDTTGRVLDVSGKSADCADGGSATTISLRDFDSLLNDVWISFLYQLPVSNNRFEGISFYRGTQQVFTVSNPSTSASAAIYLSSNLAGGALVNTGRGTFGQTHFIVLKLTKGGGAEGVDRVEAFVDPILDGMPDSPLAIVDGSDFDFNRVRLAGQNGASLRLDEIRVGTSWEDVSPHATPSDIDSDMDGLSDARENVLGLDPNVSDAALIAALKANAGWFSLHGTGEIRDMSIGGMTILQNTPGNLEYSFSLRDRFGTPTEVIDRPLTTPPDRRFLRLKIETP